MNLKKYIPAFLVIIAVSCKEPMYDMPEPAIESSTAMANIEVINAVPDATSTQIYFDNEKIRPDVPFDYLGTTPYLQLPSGGTRQIRLKDETTVLVASNFAINFDKNYTIFIANTAAKAKAILATDDLSNPAAGKVKIRFIHLASDVTDKIELYNTTAKKVLLETNKTASNLATGSGSVPAFESVNAGTYNLSIRANGNAKPTWSPVLFTYTFQAGKIYTVFLRGNASAKVDVQKLGYSIIQHN